MKDKNEYITSDLHFCHANIIKYCDRPYDYTSMSDVYCMNEDILKLFDNLPDEENVVIWNLGDVFFSKEISNLGVNGMSGYVSRMKGTKRKLNLVLGNHDRTILKSFKIKNKSLVEFFMELGFSKVYDTPILVRNNYILCHEPVYIGKNSTFKVIYGHTHTETVASDTFKIDLENYKMEAKAYKKNGLEPPKPKIVYPEKSINLRDYFNVCLDYHKKILRLDDVVSTLEDKNYKGQE